MTGTRALLLAGIAAGFPVWSAARQDWPEYLGGPDRNHYSPCAQIRPENVAELKVAWEFHTGDFGQNQCSPIVVDGILYGTTPKGDVFALDGATGRLRWRFSDPSEASANSNDRGVAYWVDKASGDRRILCTIGSQLYALNADTGERIAGFGTAGRVSLKAGLGPQAQEKWVVSTSPGTVFGDLIAMPTRVGEDAGAAPGWIQAFNVRSGTLAWVFRTIPYPGEPGYETWSKDSYQNTKVGSANCWPGMAIDRSRGILYVPTGSAAPDFWGGNRVGQNLYADCLLALDAATGKLLWYFQCTHHDIWDRDLPAPPNLVTLVRDGRRIDAVAQISKSGYTYVFDRVTGQPVFPIVETPVPASALPGESAWPTQPIPTLPEPFARQDLSVADLSPFAENRAELLAEFTAARHGRFQPFSATETVLFPGFDGGGEWGGAAVAPDGVMYVNANEMAWVPSLGAALQGGALARLGRGGQLYAQFCAGCHGQQRQGQPASGIPSLVDVSRRVEAKDIIALIATGRRMMPGFPMLAPADRQRISDFLKGGESEDETPAPGGGSALTPAPATPYRLNGYKKFLDSRGYPAIAPPWGTLTAIDLNTGRRKWRIPLGELQELTARGIPPTGTENYGGPVVTAGGLLFIAATKDGRFRAFDRSTGRMLWQTALPAAAFATPCCYEINGKQFVALACGGSKLNTPSGDSYVAFALP